MAYGKTPAFYRVFAFLSIPLQFFFFDLHSSPFLFIPLFLFWDPKLAKMNTFNCNLLHKKLPFQIPNLVPSRDLSKNVQNEQFLSGQLFLQFRFTPRLNNVRGSFFLCWISPF